MMPKLLRPHITRRNGLWYVLLGIEPLFRHESLDDAFFAARLVWRYM